MPKDRFRILFLLTGKSFFWVVEIESDSAADGLSGGLRVCLSLGFRLLSQHVLYWICSISSPLLLPLPHFPKPQNFSLSSMISLLFLCAKPFVPNVFSFTDAVPLHFLFFLSSSFLLQISRHSSCSVSHSASPSLSRWGVVHRTDGRFLGKRLCDLQEYGRSLYHEDRDWP